MSQPQKGEVTAIAVTGNRGLSMTSLAEMKEFAAYVLASPFAPRGFGSVEAIIVALQYGFELGLTPMQALQNIAVINGKPSIYGDAMLAVVRASGLLESFRETFEGTGDNRRAICISKRRGSSEPRVTEFSVKDAKQAGLWGKSGPWQQYSDRMLMFRSRSFNLRDEFGDVLKGMIAVEEAQDIPDEPKNVTPNTERLAARAVTLPVGNVIEADELTVVAVEWLTDDQINLLSAELESIGKTLDAYLDYKGLERGELTLDHGDEIEEIVRKQRAKTAGQE